MVCTCLCCLIECVMRLRVKRVRYDVLLYCVSFVFLFVCVLLLICLCAVNLIYRVPVCGLCLRCFALKRLGLNVLACWSCDFL